MTDMTQAEALTILKTGANVFLTGEPGSGKTHTVNEYVAWLRARGIEPAITASTGIAATHIGGLTIHSWSGIGIRRSLSPYDLDQIGQNKRVVDRVANAKVLIIDEVSMLSADTLSMVDAVCREVRRDERAFGGLSVVLVGDFFQLPPVESRDQEEEQAAIDVVKGGRFAFDSSAWKAMNPIICYLSEQHRQEDKEFLEFLTAIRRGEVIEDHIALLRTRYASKPKNGMTQLYSHNADVNALNDAELAKLPGEAKRYDMVKNGPERLTANLVRGCLSPEALYLKVGARVMFTKNDPIFRRYANGTLGVVESFAESGYPVVRTHDGRVVEADPSEWRLTEGDRVLGSIAQVPLRLAWAMTVHKSQGMSLDAAHMNLADTFEYGQGYVALSRVRSLAGLSLAGLNARALEVHPEILQKDAQFRAEAEAAADAFAKMPEAELATLQANFVEAMGGHEPEEGAVFAPKPLEKTKLEVLREKHPNAYRPWSDEEDEKLEELFRAGTTPAKLSKEFGRQNGAIHARLIKLGLVEPD